MHRNASAAPAPREPKALALSRVHLDILVLCVLIAAVLLLIFNGSNLFQAVLARSDASSGQAIQIATVALTLNVALIMFGWRRYVDLVHEAEKRADGEARAAHLASTDTITGLNNRKGFADRGQQMREAAARRGEWLAILSLRMHRFKAVNDRHGYEVGDEMLRNIAAAITDEVPEGSVAARLNGDEFAIIFPIEPGQPATAERIGEAVLRSITRPFDVGSRLIEIGAYLGVASSPAADIAVPDLLRRADIAMDHARSGRVARPVWFDAGMERALLAQGEIEQGIRFGLEHGQFIPFFEPQVDLGTGEIIGFEVLARWKHPLSGIVAPDDFIGVAEENGLIGRLSEQVIGAALEQAAGWDPAIKLSVNVSPAQLADPWLSQKIVRILTETGFPADRLVVEITESSLFADLDLARSISTSLKNQGIRLALDDFGTGFSSLAHLRSLPFDVIKIDRSFVATIHHDSQSAAIVRAVTSLANAIDIPVTVEGIEDAATHAAVLGFGCAVGQGWYFGKPMSGEQAEELLSRREVPESGSRAAAR